MTTFDDYVNTILERVVTEQDQGAPPAPDGGAAPAPPPPAPPGPDMGGGDMMGDQPPEAPPAPEDNSVKKETDKIAYIEQTLRGLVDPSSGITPDEFAEFLDTYVTKDLEAAKNKPEMKQYYHKLYKNLNLLIKIRDAIHRDYPKLFEGLKNSLTHITNEPDLSAGGTGNKTANNGPGV